MAHDINIHPPAAGCSNVSDIDYSNWRDVLDVDREARASDVKRAYYKLALIHHPDKATGSDADDFVLIRAAYTLGLRLAPL
jgi:DnaJ-class molecular chaperone